jgi:hypothetical protein
MHNMEDGTNKTIKFVQRKNNYIYLGIVRAYIYIYIYFIYRASENLPYVNLMIVYGADRI